MAFLPDPEYPVRLNRTRELYMKGWSSQRIARELGVSTHTVVNYLGILRRTGEIPSRFDMQASASLEEFLSHDDSARVAQAMEVSVRTAERYRNRLVEMELLPPLPATRRNKADAETLARAKVLLEDGAGYAEAARTLDVDHKTLSRHFPDLGLSTAESIRRAIMGRKFNRLPDFLEAS